MPNLYRAFRYAMARRVLPRCTSAVSTDLEAKIKRFGGEDSAALDRRRRDDAMRGASSLSD